MFIYSNSISSDTKLQQNKAKARERDGNKCQECGSKEHLHVHHISWRSMDGSDEASNLITLCDKCHSFKHPFVQVSLGMRFIRSISYGLKLLVWQLGLRRGKPLSNISFFLRYLGLTSLRPGQQEIIESTMAGNDTLAIMPTGSGKSLCFMIPAIIYPEGLTIVVTPTKSLMIDQTRSALRKGIPATYINSDLHKNEIQLRLKGVQEGLFKLLYVAPERFKLPFINAVKQVKINLFVVDEAHCVYDWADTFRPDYLELGKIREELGMPPMPALTATANVDVQKEIARRLGMMDPNIYAGGFDRSNIALNVVTAPSYLEKRKILVSLLKRLDGPGIVFTNMTKEAEDLTMFLSERGFNVKCYHGQMNKKIREVTQQQFMDSQIPLIVATKAFSMGIDKAGIRFIIHFAMPGSLNDYYQAIGRCGRDSEVAVAILLISNGDDDEPRQLIDYGHPDPDFFAACAEVIEHCTVGQCIASVVEEEAEKALYADTESQFKTAVSAVVERRGLKESKKAAIRREMRKIIDLLEKYRFVKIEGFADSARAPFSDMKLNRHITGKDIQMIHERARRSRENAERELKRMLEFCTKSEGCRRKEILDYFGEQAEGIKPWARIHSVLGRWFGKEIEETALCCDVCGTNLKIGDVAIACDNKLCGEISTSGYEERKTVDEPRHESKDLLILKQLIREDAEATLIYERLSRFRESKAAHLGMPAIFMSDEWSICQISLEKPQDVAHLLKIKGVTYQGLSDYGEEVISIVRQCLSGNNGAMFERDAPVK